LGWIRDFTKWNGRSDILIGWVKDGEVHFADRFAPVKAMPIVDMYQDFYNISGGETKSSSESGLSQPAVIGISAGGAIVGLVIVAFLIYLYLRSRRSTKMEYEAMPGDGYGGTNEGVDRPAYQQADNKSGKEPVPL